MASTIKVDKIEGSTGSTITVPTGQTLTVTDGIPVASGGTGLASFTAGDILYATGSTTLAKLGKGTAEQVLAMNSGATAPDWGSVDLTVLPTITVAKGGTNIASFVAGDILYATGTTTLAKLAKGSGSQTLKMNSGATAPEWTTVAAASSDVVKIADITETAVSTFDVDGHFTSDYRYYKLIIHNLVMSSNTTHLYAYMLVSGSVSTGSYYRVTAARMYTDSTPSNNEAYYGDGDATSEFRVGWGDTPNTTAANTPVNGTFTIFDPLNATRTKNITWEYAQNIINPMQYQYGYGNYTQTNACSGIQFYPGTGTMTADMTLYGYKG